MEWIGVNETETPRTGGMMVPSAEIRLLEEDEV